MERLSVKQQQIYDYIILFSREHGYPPTIREIGMAMNLHSSSTVHFHLRKLVEEGLIRKTSGKGRTISLLHPPPDMQNHVPVINGNDEEYVFYDTGKRVEEFCAVRVPDDAMKNAGILQGDLLVIHQRSAANNGEIIVVNLHQELLIRRLSIQPGGQVWLLPENPDYAPVDGMQSRVLGRTVAVIRQY